MTADQGLTSGASLCSGGGVWSQHEQASNIKAEQFRSFTRANYEHKVATAISVFSSQAMYDRLYIYPEATLLIGSTVDLQDHVGVEQ